MKFCVLLANVVIVTNAFNRISIKNSKTSMFMNPHDIIEPLVNFQQHFHPQLFDLTNSFLLSDEMVEAATKTASEMQSDVLQAQNAAVAAGEASRYSVIDKTGFIGFIADNVEKSIDFGHDIIKMTGVKYTYGYSIILFTFFVKLLTLPLTTKQLESTTKMQQLTPLQQKIQKVYANDEQTKNQMMAQLFQTAQVNPLAGCLPALVQIPIFISLYRAIQNLIAENKLDEPFLWIPDLEGPVYMKPPQNSMDWIKSIFTGTPDLGWSDTIAFLTIPFLLYVSQTISQKVLQPPKDPNKVLTEQEQISQGLINNLPFIVAFFAINVPAGLGLYWIINNILTTVITITVKKQFADMPIPIEVTRMMAAIEGGTTVVAPKKMSTGKNELRGFGEMDDTTGGSSAGFKKEGFGKPIDASYTDSKSDIKLDTSAATAAAVVEGGSEATDGGSTASDSASSDKKNKSRAQERREKKRNK